MTSGSSVLEAALDFFSGLDPASRADHLIDVADQFREVPENIQKRPFPEARRIPYCESEAYVWVVPNADGTIELYFAVENPSGISAKALAAILDQTLSGRPAEEAAALDPNLVEKIFRQNISMGKGMGLMAIVQAVRQEAGKIISES